MLHRLFGLLVVLVLMLTPVASHAQTEGLGLGASLGVSNSATFDVNPVGVSLKAWTTDRQAFAAVSSFAIAGDEGRSYVLIQGDYLFHDFNQLDVGDGLLALYVGPGLQLTFVENADERLSLRAPLGVNYLLGSAPIDVFVEAAPTIQVTDPAELRFEGAIGFRYFFGQ